MRRFVCVLMLSAVAGCQSQTSSPAVSSPEGESPVIAEALQLLNRGEASQGIELLNAAIEKQPNIGRLYGARATFHHRAGLYPLALEDLDRAVSCAPQDAQLLNNRGYIHLALQQYDEAIHDLDQAVSLNPQLTSAFNNRGLVSLAQGKFRDAIERFSQALQLDPNYVDALNNRGFAWMELGRYEEAYADLNQVLRVSPQYVNAFHNRGLLRARAGELEAALLDFTEAMMLDPTNPKYYQHRAETYVALGRAEEAIADQRKVEWMLRIQQLNREVATRPRSAAAWTNRAVHFWEHGDETKAKADAEQALSFDAGYGPALVLKARFALAEGGYDETLTLSTAALESDDAQAAYSIRGDALLALKRYDEALESYAAAKRFDESVAEAHFRKSQSLAAQGQTEAAQQQLEQALELDPDIESRLR